MKSSTSNLPDSVIGIAFSGCKNNRSRVKMQLPSTVSSSDSVHIEVKYAQGFSVSYHDNFRLVDVQDPQHESETVYR